MVVRKRGDTHDRKPDPEINSIANQQHQDRSSNTVHSTACPQLNGNEFSGSYYNFRAQGNNIMLHVRSSTEAAFSNEAEMFLKKILPISNHEQMELDLTTLQRFAEKAIQAAAELGDLIRFQKALRERHTKEQNGKFDELSPEATIQRRIGSLQAEIALGGDCFIRKAVSLGVSGAAELFSIKINEYYSEQELKELN